MSREEAASRASTMGRQCAAAVCSMGESSDTDSGWEDGMQQCELRGMEHAKSWPFHSPRHIQEVRSALSAVPRSGKSIRFADSYGLPLVSVLHYRQCDTVDEFRGSLLSRKNGCQSGWTSARAAMEDLWSVEDELELSLSATGGGIPGGRVNSWDLPATRRLRRGSKSSLAKVATSGATSGAAGSYSSSSSSSRNRSSPEPKLELQGGPLNLCNVRERVCNQKVSLEYVSFQDNSLFGSIIVNNVAFEKQVSIRYTFNQWKTSSDLSATYVPGSTAQDGSTDRFSFSLVLPVDLSAKGSQFQMQFAICYKASSTEYWDSNNGSNYVVVVCS